MGTDEVYLYGIENWGPWAVHNYVAARLLWRPQQDITALRQQWLARAFGPGDPVVAGLLDDIEARIAAYMRAQRARLGLFRADVARLQAHMERAGRLAP